MGQVIVLFFFAFLCFYLASLFDENLNNKFVKLGILNHLTYGEFIKKVRPPNYLTHHDTHIVAQWCTNNSFSQNYNIVLVFDKQGNFIRKHMETFSSATPPKIWVGVRI